MRDLRMTGAVVLVAHEAPGASGLCGSPAGLIARAAASATGMPLESLRITHACPHCGSVDHGRPLVETVPAGERVCAVSFSRSVGFEAAAATRREAIGIDIESIGNVSQHRVADVVLHSAERGTVDGLPHDEAARRLAHHWMAKEAILKLTGDGLRVPPSELQLRIIGDRVILVSWPHGIDLDVAPSVTLFTVSHDVVGALAVR